MKSVKILLKFSVSSLISFMVDYGLYCIFCCFLNLTVSNILARICSATVNYTINRRFVFLSETDVKKSALQYAGLAGMILLCNTVLLNFLTYAGMNRYLAKILTEVILFFGSYLVQHGIIFRKR